METVSSKKKGRYTALRLKTNLLKYRRKPLKMLAFSMVF